VPEEELLARVHTIQDRTRGLTERASAALVDMISAVKTAQDVNVSGNVLDPALRLQRRAQWRIDWVYSENSHGFHASQEAARLLGEAIDYARQGEALARQALAPDQAPRRVSPPVIESATPDDRAPSRQ
jgi:nitrite reductase (cytochrome c-552)